LDYFTIKTESGMYHAHDGNPASTRLFPVCKGKARPIRPSRGPPILVPSPVVKLERTAKGMWSTDRRHAAKYRAPAPAATSMRRLLLSANAG